MLVIHKFSIPLKSIFTIEMPKGAKILKVDVQSKKPRFWALVNDKNELHLRKFHLISTGEKIRLPVTSTLDYISTFQLDKSAEVYHLFEV